MFSDSLFDQPTTASTFLKEDLQPFTTYEFRLVAINSYGDTYSQWATVTTMQDSTYIFIALIKQFSIFSISSNI